MPRWRNRANFRSRAAPAAKPARVPGALRLESRRIDRRPDQNHRCRRAKATTWDATKCLRRAETACNLNYPEVLIYQNTLVIPILVIATLVIATLVIPRCLSSRDTCHPERSEGSWFLPALS